MVRASFTVYERFPNWETRATAATTMYVIITFFFLETKLSLFKMYLLLVYLLKNISREGGAKNISLKTVAVIMLSFSN